MSLQEEIAKKTSEIYREAPIPQIFVGQREDGKSTQPQEIT